jgi:hypothetical protein
VDAVHERLVSVARDLSDTARLRVDDNTPIFAAGRLAGEDGERRRFALELHRDLVDRCTRGLRRGRGQGGTELRGPFSERRAELHGTHEVTRRLPQRFLSAEKLRSGDDDSGDGDKEEDERSRQGNPSMPLTPEIGRHEKDLRTVVIMTES